jgi:hypothetical protein
MMRSNGFRLGLIGLTLGAAALVTVTRSPDSGAAFPWDSIRDDGLTEVEVVGLLGPPAAILPPPSYFGEGKVLVYPLRSGWAGYSHAPVLRIEFDSAGLVRDMGFLQPQTGEHLPVREKLERARKRLSCGRSIVDGTHFGVRPEAALEEIRPGESRREDVVEVLAAFQPPPSRRTVPFPRKWMAGSHEIWEYYVERPSPLFFPAQTEAWFYFISDGTFLRNFNRGFSGCVT